jgi:hypothetical protein
VSIAWGALHDTNADGLEGMFGQLAADMTSAVKAAPVRTAKDRYLFIKKRERPT